MCGRFALGGADDDEVIQIFRDQALGRGNDDDNANRVLPPQEYEQLGGGGRGGGDGDGRGGGAVASGSGSSTNVSAMDEDLTVRWENEHVAKQFRPRYNVRLHSPAQQHIN